MVTATALSYLLAGFLGALILVYFLRLLTSNSAWRLFTGSSEETRVLPPLAFGGLVFVVPVLVYLSLLAAEDLIWARGLVAGCAIAAGLGLWGDIRSVGVRVRFAGLLVAIGAVLWSFDSTLAVMQWGWLPALCIVAAMFWHVTLLDAMDSVDGLVGVHCLLFCVGMQVLGQGIPGWAGDVTWLLAGTVLGLLVFNWPPARIRVGKAGSGLLGLLLAVLVLYAVASDLLPLVACLILLAGCWFDASYTWCVRMFRGRAAAGSGNGERRLFQKVADSKGPKWTLAIYMALHLFWLVPLAWLSLRYGQFDWPILLLAVAPIAGAARYRMPHVAEED
ncbi:MAG: hypothetical protein OES38_10140 [Gammaproteobacteria bacterium]|nr:hypothetical protein [Gammaproteobacteria bacterium]